MYLYRFHRYNGRRQNQYTCDHDQLGDWGFCLLWHSIHDVGLVKAKTMSNICLPAAVGSIVYGVVHGTEVLLTFGRIKGSSRIILNTFQTLKFSGYIGRL